MAEIWTQEKQVEVICEVIRGVLEKWDRRYATREEINLIHMYRNVRSAYIHFQRRAKEIADKFGGICQQCEGHCCHSYTPSVNNMFAAAIGKFGFIQDVNEQDLLDWIPPTNPSCGFGCPFLWPLGCGFDRFYRPILCAQYTCADWRAKATPEEGNWMDTVCDYGFLLRDSVEWLAYQASSDGILAGILHIHIALR